LLAHIKAFSTVKKNYEQLALRVYREVHNINDPTPEMIHQTARSFRMADIRKWASLTIAVALVVLALVWKWM
jgi:hypothetical protein